jgi:putative membrane protein
MLPVIVYSFFAVRYLTPNRLPALQLIAVFSMGMPALLALIRLCLGKSHEAEQLQWPRA